MKVMIERVEHGNVRVMLLKDGYVIADNFLNPSQEPGELLTTVLRYIERLEVA